ncbi:4-hydroxythreonine-4-phosphate dehydrogenase PdxA [Moraxella caviae]|uniref:4-hydroxythreonine-4-phosphate dehydrogenase n=1 Tax=Moraxella caviae TaxID=34060 RepID=A0A1T0A8X2_9GAMM|nr:4-hydroxythreonine-4-phosphate dehydrogenase PdxA [Moraxella caviae]OOR92079.1 4-hydroxythreonine-4-phosphate dehydrogenase PdxA [Moraxella caviae]STZ14433.1 4-hydroxythreonine-4-phosphate dehydrogenase [Moraxella caviae]VEW10480.1 4-hydroxythreonine-4-phosphate dehydrogenase [Moraxella caviae]
MQNKPLVITTGEPAGIGMDIVIDVLAKHRSAISTDLIILADAQAFFERFECLKSLDKTLVLPEIFVLKLSKQAFTELSCSDLFANKSEWDNFVEKLNNSLQEKSANNSKLMLVDVACAEKVVAGQLNTANAKMVANQLYLAHRLASAGVVAGIVTAPLQKSVLIDGGVTLADGAMFSGHTEYFMQAAGCDKVVMMLANAKMRVALVTTHLPLKDVAAAITPEAVRQTVQITHDALVQQFAIKNPKILVCGLNPHAGEGGHLGDEELTVINPVLQTLINDGMDISLAMPADTLFTDKYLQSADAVISMYHDQGLPVLKSHGFGDTVNITLGLPYVRTSVDHGTALDLAGIGRASSSSLLQAISVALQMNGQADT